MNVLRTLSKARSTMYRAARDTGNVQAAIRGPVPLAKRYARRKVYAGVYSVLARALRKGGL
jgi:hypothetical protein